MRRTLILFLTQLLLWTVLAQINHALTGVRVYLFTGSLFITFIALTQPTRPGLACALLGGVLCDANAPASLFGLHTLLYVGGFLLIHHVRDRVPRDDTVGRIVVALLVNLALFLALSLLQIGRSPAPAAVWPRLLVDLFCSQIFLGLIARWFFSLQTQSLILARVDREAFA